MPVQFGMTGENELEKKKPGLKTRLLFFSGLEVNVFVPATRSAHPEPDFPSLRWDD